MDGLDFAFRRTSMHWPRTMSDLFMLPASTSRSAEVFLERSEPARSTMVRLDDVIVEERCFNSIVKIAWEREEVAFILVSLLCLD